MLRSGRVGSVVGLGCFHCSYKYLLTMTHKRGINSLCLTLCCHLDDRRRMLA